MIKLFHNITPKKNELSATEISIFFLKNLHILIITTSIVSYFFYSLMDKNYTYENKYNKTASGYLLPGKHSHVAKLELINSEISEILKFGKISSGASAIINITNVQQLIDYSQNLLNSKNHPKSIDINNIEHSDFRILTDPTIINLKTGDTEIHSVYFELTFPDFENAEKLNT